jgi:hypothetical protein
LWATIISGTLIGLFDEGWVFGCPTLIFLPTGNNLILILNSGESFYMGMPIPPHQFNPKTCIQLDKRKLEMHSGRCSCASPNSVSTLCRVRYKSQKQPYLPLAMTFPWAGRSRRWS